MQVKKSDILKLITEKFASKAQQKYFYAQANKGGKEGEKFKDMAKEFSKTTDFNDLPDKITKEDELKGGKSDNKPDEIFDPKELAMGIKVELEHTNNKEIAKEIAKDHLGEDPHYYRKLKKSGLADELTEENIDEDYPSNFDLNKFKAFKTFKERVDYANQNLPKLGNGSSRVVYKIDEQKVLKIAKNAKGLEQNRTELEISRYEDIVAEVFDHDENYLWLEMELAKKITKSEFKKQLGFSFDDLGMLLRNFQNSNNGRGDIFKIDKNIQDHIYETEFYNELQNMIGNYDIGAGDLARINSYGEVIRNGKPTIVVIDYGLTEGKYNEFYK